LAPNQIIKAVKISFMCRYLLGKYRKKTGHTIIKYAVYDGVQNKLFDYFSTLYNCYNQLNTSIN